MNIEEIRAEAAIEYCEDIIDGLSELADASSGDESKTILKVISAIQAMMVYDFRLSINKLDS